MGPDGITLPPHMDNGAFAEGWAVKAKALHGLARGGGHDAVQSTAGNWIAQAAAKDWKEAVGNENAKVKWPQYAKALIDEKAGPLKATTKANGLTGPAVLFVL